MPPPKWPQDQRAIAATQLQLKSDRQQIAQRTHQVERIAIASYVLDGSVSSSSGASLFAENVSTVQSANEYATITIGNLNEAVDKLHSAQRSAQGTLQVLVRQSDRDRAEQTAQANYLAQSTSTVSQMESVQARGHGTAGASGGPAERSIGTGGRRRRGDGAEGNGPEVRRDDRQSAGRHQRRARRRSSLP